LGRAAAFVGCQSYTTEDGLDFLSLAPKIGIVISTTSYPSSQANQALADLRAGRFEGAAVSHPIRTSFWR
jgi:propanol-preferring alcohol dehydrogenase